MAEEEIGARLRLKDRKQFSDDANRASKDIKDIGDSANKADRAGRNMGSGLGVAKKGLGGLASAAKVGVTALAAVGAGIAAVSVKSIGLAMDAGETASKFTTVFGDMSDEVSKFVEQTNREFGIPTAELQDAAAGFGIFGKAAGVATDELPEFSQQMVQAGLDMGSFYNRDPSEVFQALRSGLVGEAEPLKQFGILMNQASLDAFALEQGLSKTTAEMSESEKVALRQQFIMANLGDAQGDLERTSGSLANQWKGLKGRVTEASTAFGTAFLPMAEKVVTALNDRLQPAIAWLQDGLPGNVAYAAEVLNGFGPRAKDAFNIAAQGPENLGSAVDTLLGPGLEPIIPVFDKIGSVIADVWTIISEGLVPAIQDVSSAVPNVLQPLTSVDNILSFLADNASTVRRVLVGLVAGFVAWKTATLAANTVIGINTLLTKANSGAIKTAIVQSKLAQAATLLWQGAQWLLNAALAANPIGLVVIAIVALIGIFALAWHHSETFRNIVTSAFTAVKNAVMSAFNWVKNNWPLLLAILTGPIGLAVLAIVKNWDTIKSGVTAVKDWIVEKFNQVTSFITGLPGRISSAASGMFDGIKNAFKGAINWVIDKWNNLSFSLPSVDIPGIGSIGGATLSTPNIPRLHTGGTTVTGGAVNMLPGEEIVILPPAATVVPMSEDVRTMAADVAAGGGANRQPIVLQVVLDRKVLAEAVYNHTGDKVART